MRRRALPAVLLLLLVGAPDRRAEGRGGPEPRFPKARATTFDAAMEAARESQDLIGLAVAVIEDGALAHVGAYGLADREKERPITHRTLFRWASVAKPVTAVALLQLVEKGKLQLDDPARKHWPSLPEDGLGAVPIEALLRQQGGVGHYAEMGDWGQRLDRLYGDRARVPWNAKKCVAVLEGAPLLATPYARYHYTTFGYNLLGAVVERAGGARYTAQVAKRIAKPLGMTTFEPDYEFERRPLRTAGYRRRGDAIVASSSGDVSWKLPGGGFHSTVGDMGRFGAGLLGDRLLSAESRERMFSLRQPEHGTTSYGMGIGVRRKDGRVTRLSHSGAQARTRTLLVLEPEHRRGFAIMTNSEWAQPSSIWRAARRALGW